MREGEREMERERDGGRERWRERERDRTKRERTAYIIMFISGISLLRASLATKIAF